MKLNLGCKYKTTKYDIILFQNVNFDKNKISSFFYRNIFIYIRGKCVYIHLLWHIKFIKKFIFIYIFFSMSFVMYSIECIKSETEEQQDRECYYFNIICYKSWKVADHLRHAVCRIHAVTSNRTKFIWLNCNTATFSIVSFGLVDQYVFFGSSNWTGQFFEFCRK